jgi:hypothetical protein
LRDGGGDRDGDGPETGVGEGQAEKRQKVGGGSRPGSR